jgi:hypothetical protein
VLPHPPPAAAGRRPSLDGVVRVHRAPRGPVRRPRWRVVLLGSCAVLVGLVVVVWGRPGWFPLVVFVAPLLSTALPRLAARRSWTELEDDGVRVFRGLLRHRTVCWEDVSTVLVEGPYQPVSALRLRSWVEVELPHVPADVAQHLRQQLDPSRGRLPVRRVISASAAHDRPRPDDDLDMEGPFRRGPRRT